MKEWYVIFRVIPTALYTAARLVSLQVCSNVRCYSSREWASLGYCFGCMCVHKRLWRNRTQKRTPRSAQSAWPLLRWYTASFRFGLFIDLASKSKSLAGLVFSRQN